MRFVCHMHTPFCGHATGEPEDYVRAAARQGLSLITFTCHIPMPHEGFGGDNIRMRLDTLPEYCTAVREAAQIGITEGIEVLLGIEAEIFPDPVIMADMVETLNEYPFDFILGSLHHQMPVYRDWLEIRGYAQDAEIIDVYFRQLTAGVKTGRYHSIAHPDVIRLYGTINEPFEPSDHEGVIKGFLEAAAEVDTCIEVNTSGLIKGDFVAHPDPLILDWAAAIGNKLTIGSDAHKTDQVGQMFGDVLPMLREKGFEHLHYFRKGKRVAVPIADMIPTLPKA